MSTTSRVLLGVSGGIAAYKAAELVRLLKRRGHAVRCALTRSGAAFVTPLSLEILSTEPVYQEEYLAAGSGGRELHIEAAAWAEVLCVAPATAHTLARLALGLADDFLSTTALAFAGPVVLAPAMHPVMWDQEPVRRHRQALEARGVRLVGPVHGPLASGEVGMGRMAEPAEIVAAIEAAAGGGALAGRSVLVTAGPTREAIDPVRFLSNRSSGKMGFAVAAEAARRGARTVLVAGPVALATPPGVERVDVVSAAEMHQAVRRLAPEADLVVMAAAVADFRPRAAAAQKLKKRDGAPAVELEPTADILSELRSWAPEALRVGFAAETRELESEARSKLEAKGADFIVANDVSRADIGFESADNEVTVFRRGAPPVRLERGPKERIAAELVDLFERAVREREIPVAGTV